MENYKEIVSKLEEEALREYKLGNITKAVHLEEQAWHALPEPKYEKDRSYLIASAMVFMLKIMQRYDDALIWAKHLMQCNLERQDDGDREFKAGTVLYHLDRKDDAWKYFDVANDKSGGRCFKSADKEYSEFFKSRLPAPKKLSRAEKAKAATEKEAARADNAFLQLQLNWDELPELKYTDPEKYKVARGAVYVAIGTQQYDRALDWAKELMKFEQNQNDGDREFMAGMALYHLDRKDDAWQYFDVANDKSQGICFQDSDATYATFYNQYKS